MIIIYLHSSHSYLQKHFNGLSFCLFVCFDAELPEMSDPECKLHTVRGLSQALKCSLSREGARCECTSGLPEKHHHV